MIEEVRLHKIKGVTMVPGRQDNVKALIQGQTLYFKAEPDNQYDPNAIKLFSDPNFTKELGYLDSLLMKEMIERGFGVDSVMVRSIGSATGNKASNWGANIMIVFKKEE